MKNLLELINQRIAAFSQIDEAANQIKNNVAAAKTSHLESSSGLTPEEVGHMWANARVRSAKRKAYDQGYAAACEGFEELVAVVFEAIESERAKLEVLKGEMEEFLEEDEPPTEPDPNDSGDDAPLELVASSDTLDD